MFGPCSVNCNFWFLIWIEILDYSQVWSTVEVWPGGWYPGGSRGDPPPPQSRPESALPPRAQQSFLTNTTQYDIRHLRVGFIWIEKSDLCVVIQGRYTDLQTSCHCFDQGLSKENGYISLLVAMVTMYLIDKWGGSIQMDLILSSICTISNHNNFFVLFSGNLWNISHTQ